METEFPRANRLSLIRTATSCYLSLFASITPALPVMHSNSPGYQACLLQRRGKGHIVRVLRFVETGLTRANVL